MENRFDELSKSLAQGVSRRRTSATQPVPEEKSRLQKLGLELLEARLAPSGFIGGPPPGGPGPIG